MDRIIAVSLNRLPICFAGGGAREAQKAQHLTAVDGHDALSPWIRGTRQWKEDAVEQP